MKEYKMDKSGAVIHIPYDPTVDGAVVAAFIGPDSEIMDGHMVGPVSLVAPMVLSMVDMVFQSMMPQNQRAFINRLEDLIVKHAKDADGIDVMMIKRSREADDE